MANFIYPKYKEAVLSSAANSSLTGGTVKAALVDAGTHGYVDTDQFYSSISSAVIGTPQTIGSVSVTNGVFNGNDITFPSVPSGTSLEALVIYIDTGVAGTSRLVAYIDSGQTGLPINPNGSNIEVTWDASGIFAL